MKQLSWLASGVQLVSGARAHPHRRLRGAGRRSSMDIGRGGAEAVTGSDQAEQVGGTQGPLGGARGVPAGVAARPLRMDRGARGEEDRRAENSELLCRRWESREERETGWGLGTWGGVGRWREEGVKNLSGSGCWDKGEI
jgi:hypothetical protein